MPQHIYKTIIIIVSILAVLALAVTAFTVFFDEAVLVRKGLIYRVAGSKKLVALTFDDGPSPEWTPKILDALKKANIKATFFMLGKHVKQYPEIAKMVAEQGHEIENHTYSHRVLIYYTMDELEMELGSTHEIIKEVTGRDTKYFRPPKAWVTDREKIKIKELGYQIILWTLNSKDWVNFDDKYIVKYISKHISPGDILLFHDSGGVFSSEGGSREETVKVIPRLAEKLRAMGYEFVTIEQLLKSGG